MFIELPPKTYQRVSSLRVAKDFNASMHDRFETNFDKFYKNITGKNKAGYTTRHKSRRLGRGSNAQK